MATNQTNISISQMLQNPTGKRSAYFSARFRIKAQLDSIFIKSLRKYRREFYAVPYVDNTTKDILFYVSVPSEAFNMNKIRWDCLIHIQYDSTKSLENRNAKFYTNSPSFIFTYCYVFNKEGILVDFIKPKIPNLALTQPPNITNPIQSRGFEKILYTAMKYLTVGGCLTDSYIDKYKQSWNKITEAQLIARVANPTRLVQIYQHAKKLDALKRNTNRKPVSTKEKKKMEDEAKKYEEFKKNNSPASVGRIIRRAPRAKITAKKAIKAIGAKKPKPKIKPKY